VATGSTLKMDRVRWPRDALDSQRWRLGLKWEAAWELIPEEGTLVRAAFSSQRHLQPSRKRSCRWWFDARLKRVIGVYWERLFVKKR
jgi:hypothetical protein